MLTGIGSLIGSSFRPLAGRVAKRGFVDPAPRSAVAAERRNEAIDVIRLIAAAFVVFVHASKSSTLAPWCHAFRFAVPFFLFASLYFQSLSLRRNPDRPLGQYIGGRIRRLYLPFLAWSVIYLVARDIKHLALLDMGAIRFHPAMLWTGTAYHLYFLPLLLAFSIILVIVHWAILRRGHSVGADFRGASPGASPGGARVWRWPLIVAAVAAGFAFAFARMPATWDEKFPNPTYGLVWSWRAMPAGFWALAFAWFMTAGPVVYTVPMSVGLAGIAMAVICSLQQVHYGIQLIPRALSGFGAMLAALSPWKWGGATISPVMATMARWGRYGYGIYLSHVLIVEAIRAVAGRLLHHGPSVALDLVIFVLGFSGSVVLVLLLGKSPRLAWLNG